MYVWPKPIVRPSRSFELYPETVGGPELIGSFTVYEQDDFDALTLEKIEEACRINTAPLPSRLLSPAGQGIDDAVVVSRPLTSTSAVPASRSLNALPSVPPWLANQEPYTVRGR